MGWLNFTSVSCVLFSGYLLFTAKNFYEIFNPLECDSSAHESSNKCLRPLANWHESYSLSLCIPYGDHHRPKSKSECRQYNELTDEETASLHNPFIKTVTISLPAKTLRNGTLVGYLVIAPREHGGDFDATKVHTTIVKRLTLSKYKKNRTRAFVNLMQDTKNNDDVMSPDDKPMPHLLTKVDLYTLSRDIVFDRTAIPQEVFYDIVVTQRGAEYLPIVFVDPLTSQKDSEFKILNVSQSELSLTVTHVRVSVGIMRLHAQIHASIDSMRELGFSDEQLDQLYSIFTDTDFYLLFLSFFVALVHLLFEFLAFKNDITFWRARKTMVGISRKSLVWRVVSHAIIFFYLLDEDTSLLILVPHGISLFIEAWKVSKAFKVSVSFGSLVPTFKQAASSQEERESNEYDAIAMRKLSYLLYPIVVCGAVYSLVYNTHKSWYSWFINSLVNGIYAFGFLFMTPQLFVNYKLKTVAHLPWKAFMFKAFNTFIDDVFAFIIKIPTMHRLACFRDDVVFVIYLYQRWLYPIDKKRHNEYGETFEAEKDDLKKD